MPLGSFYNGAWYIYIEKWLQSSFYSYLVKNLLQSFFHYYEKPNCIEKSRINWSRNKIIPNKNQKLLKMKSQRLFHVFLFYARMLKTLRPAVWKKISTARENLLEKM